MPIGSVIFLLVFCAIASFLLYGLWKVENDRYEFRKKHGIDPKYHGWIIRDDDSNKDQ